MALPPSLFLVSCGPVGARVAELLDEAPVTVTRAEAATLAQASPGELEAVLDGSGAEAALVALSRPRPALLSALNVALHRRGWPWTVGLLDQNSVRLGPLVRPGLTACHECFRLRYFTHSAERRVELPLERFWDQHPRAGFEGRLAALDGLAAALVAAQWEALASPASPADGSFVRFEPLTGEWGRHEVARVGVCGVCAPPAEPREWTRVHLAAALAAEPEVVRAR